MNELHYKSAVELAALLRAKKLGCLELLDHFLARVERHNPRLNAIIHLDAKRARRRAREADAALARGEVWGPFHGVPMTIKESFDVEGWPTTWGRPDLKDNLARADSVVVARMQAAGVVLFGKTNVPIHLADWQSFNAVYGTTENPWRFGLTPGGSSGGSAAALAAGLTGVEAGSDIGASIRNPAHYCGVYGHKPTYGIVPPRGQATPGVLAAADISVVGPMTRGAEDLEPALLAMAGPDELEAAAWRLDLPPTRKTSLKDFRVAIKLRDPVSDVDSEYLDRLQATADALAKAGATVREAEPDFDTRRYHEVYILMLRAATSGRLADADIERYRRLAAEQPDNGYLSLMAKAQGMGHREWLPLNNERAHFRWSWAEFFREWDVLLCPAAASAAWPHDQQGERHDRTILVNGKRVPTTDQMFWAGYASLAYLPATVGPIGLTRSGLPVGVQAITASGEDRTAIAFIRALSAAVGGFQPPPGYG
jgi:amidase